MQAERDPATPRSTDQPATGLPELPRDLGGANMQDSVYSALFEGIVTGKLRPGERLLIDDVAEHFGVSKIPVREALKALEGKGWVESAPRRGTYVRKNCSSYASCWSRPSPGWPRTAAARCTCSSSASSSTKASPRSSATTTPLARARTHSSIR